MKYAPNEKGRTRRRSKADLTKGAFGRPKHLKRRNG